MGGAGGGAVRGGGVRDRPVIDLGRVVLRDDRGGAWRVWMSFGYGRWAGFTTPLPRPLRKIVRTAMVQDVPKRDRVLIAVGFTAATFLAFAVFGHIIARSAFSLLARRPEWLSMWFFTGVMILRYIGCFGILFSVSDILIGRLSRRHYHRIRIQTLLAAGHCPLCGYLIAAAPVESDGCIVCPECGGAWKQPSVVASA